MFSFWCKRLIGEVESGRCHEGKTETDKQADRKTEGAERDKGKEQGQRKQE